MTFKDLHEKQEKKQTKEKLSIVDWTALIIGILLNLILIIIYFLVK